MSPTPLPSWQKGEVARLRSVHLKTSDGLPIPTIGTVIVAKLKKGDAKPLELTLKRAEGDDAGPFTAEFPLDVTGEWSGDIVATGAFPTKRPLKPWTVRDD